MPTSLPEQAAEIVSRADQVERAENMARIIRVFSGDLGLSGHMAAWAKAGDNAPLVADIDTLMSTLSDLRDLVTGDAR
jgi:uncharacterized alpha-E superfamily protein